MTNRRDFVFASAAVGAATAVHQSSVAAAGDKELRIGVMGLSRGVSLAEDFEKSEGVDVAYLCDVDDARAESVVRQFNQKLNADAKVVRDFRQMLEDPELDILICAAPNHWHAPATIMACKAGKHVYVEKPCSHNPREGEWMIEASEKFDCLVQMGTQRRSAPGTREAMQRLHDGAIGEVHLARCYYHNLRGSIGSGNEAEIPDNLDYELWQGPVVRKPYRSNLVHYNWHWFWHYGGGELANNGVHGLDLCRWGLQVDYPIRTMSSGGRYWFEDDQETPDVQSVVYEFEGKKQIAWDSLSCNKHGPGLMATFYGDQGALELDSDGQYRQYDRNNKLVHTGEDSSVGQPEHIANFLEAVRKNDRSMLTQPITEGHISTMLCHLGNIAYRTQRTVQSDPTNGRILNDKEQQKYWQREYDPAWVDAVTM